MTCIIGLAENDTVYMGGDSCAANSWYRFTINNPKVFRNDKFLIGFTGYLRMGQLLEHKLSVHPQGEESDMAYLVSEFVESVRTCFKDGGIAKIESNEETVDGEFLVGYRGKIYVFTSGFSIFEHKNQVAACGHGFLQALAAMEALKDDMEPEARIMRALEIAAQTSQYVQPPFHVLKMENEKK